MIEFPAPKKVRIGTPSDLISYQAGETFRTAGISGVLGPPFGVDPRLHDRREVRRVVCVLLGGELHVARVLEHRQVVGLVDLAVTGVAEAVLDLADPPAALLVADAPIVREL